MQLVVSPNALRGEPVTFLVSLGVSGKSASSLPTAGSRVFGRKHADRHREDQCRLHTALCRRFVRGSPSLRRGHLEQGTLFRRMQWSTDEKAAMVVWFKHTLRCSRRIPVADRLQRLYSMAGGACLSEAGGWTQSTETCRRCDALGGRWLRAMIPYRADRGRPWHECGPAAARFARSHARAMRFPSLWCLRCQ